MLLGALIVGGLTAYWHGLRPGAWAAGATLVLLLVASVVPPLALPIHLLLAGGLVVICVVGARRPQPADAAQATRWVRTTLGHAVSLLRSRFIQPPPGRKPDENHRDPR